MAESTEKKNISDEVLNIVSEHPIATGVAIGAGMLYLSAKLQEHITYKAVLKANIDAYKTIMDNLR